MAAKATHLEEEVSKYPANASCIASVGYTEQLLWAVGNPA